MERRSKDVRVLNLVFGFEGTTFYLRKKNKSSGNCFFLLFGWKMYVIIWEKVNAGINLKRMRWKKWIQRFFLKTERMN